MEEAGYLVIVLFREGSGYDGGLMRQFAGDVTGVIHSKL